MARRKVDENGTVTFGVAMNLTLEQYIEVLRKTAATGKKESEVLAEALTEALKGANTPKV